MFAWTKPHKNLWPISKSFRNADFLRTRGRMLIKACSQPTHLHAVVPTKLHKSSSTPTAGSTKWMIRITPEKQRCILFMLFWPTTMPVKYLIICSSSNNKNKQQQIFHHQCHLFVTYGYAWTGRPVLRLLDLVTFLLPQLNDYLSSFMGLFWLTFYIPYSSSMSIKVNN